MLSGFWKGNAVRPCTPLELLVFTLSDTGNGWRIFELRNGMTIQTTVKWNAEWDWEDIKLLVVFQKTQTSDLWLRQQWC